MIYSALVLSQEIKDKEAAENFKKFLELAQKAFKQQYETGDSTIPQIPFRPFRLWEYMPKESEIDKGYKQYVVCSY